MRTAPQFKEIVQRPMRHARRLKMLQNRDKERRLRTLVTDARRLQMVNNAVTPRQLIRGAMCQRGELQR